MKIRNFSLSTWFTGIVVAVLPALVFARDGKTPSADHKAAAAGSKAAEADLEQSKAQFEHAERTQSTTPQTGLPAEAQQGINPAEVEKTFGRQVSVVDLSSLTPDQSRALQQTLADRGYYHGKVDGVIGTETRNAVGKLLARQFALNQRFVRQGRVTEPFLAGLGVQANELAPVSGTDAKHVRPQAISPASEATPRAKHDAKKHPRNEPVPAADKSNDQSKDTAGSSSGDTSSSEPSRNESNAGSTGDNSTGSAGSGSRNGDAPSASPDPLSGYWDQPG